MMVLSAAATPTVGDCENIPKLGSETLKRYSNVGYSSGLCLVRAMASQAIARTVNVSNLVRKSCMTCCRVISVSQVLEDLLPQAEESRLNHHVMCTGTLQ